MEGQILRLQGQPVVCSRAPVAIGARTDPGCEPDRRGSVASRPSPVPYGPSLERPGPSMDARRCWWPIPWPAAAARTHRPTRPCRPTPSSAAPTPSEMHRPPSRRPGQTPSRLVRQVCRSPMLAPTSNARRPGGSRPMPRRIGVVRGRAPSTSIRRCGTPRWMQRTGAWFPRRRVTALRWHRRRRCCFPTPPWTRVMAPPPRDRLRRRPRPPWCPGPRERTRWCRAAPMIPSSHLRRQT